MDVCICCRPANRGFSHCPIKVGRQRAEATLVYVMATSTSVSRETSCRMARNHISTGIYSCATLDFDMKFCKNSYSSRISADKRFQKNVCRPTHFARDRVSAVRSAWQSYTFICTWQTEKKSVDSARSSVSAMWQITVEMQYIAHGATGRIGYCLQVDERMSRCISNTRDDLCLSD